MCAQVGDMDASVCFYRKVRSVLSFLLGSQAVICYRLDVW